MNNRTYFRLPPKPKKSKTGIIVVTLLVIFCVIVGFLYYVKKAEVTFAVSPKDATVKLGGQEVSSSVLNNIKAGTYDLVVTRTGYVPYRSTATFSRGKHPAQEIVLSPNQHMLTLHSKPKNAEYILTLPNGEVRQGATPFSEEVMAGEVSIELMHEDYGSFEETYFHDAPTERTLYLDPDGQVVHHLFDIQKAPSPKGVAFSHDDSEIWTTLLMNKENGVAIYDANDGSLKKEIDLKGNGGVEVVFSQDGSKAYVSQMETDTIYEINTETYEIVRTFKTKSTWCKVMELSHDGKKLYVSNWSGNNVSEINIETGEVERLIPTIKTPRGLYETADGAFLYVAGFARGELMKIDLSTGKGDIIYTSNGALRHIVPDEEKNILYISDMANDEIYIHDMITGSTDFFVDTDVNPNTIVLSPDKNILYVSCRGKNADSSYYVPGPEWGSVLLFDTQTGDMLDAIVGGNQPTALAVSQDGTKMVYSNFLDANLQVYSIPDFLTLKRAEGGRSKVYKNELKK